MVTIIRVLRPGRVLEFGSGFSTLVMAHTLQEIGEGFIDSIDNSKKWSGITQAQLRARGFQPRVRLAVFHLGLRFYSGQFHVIHKVPAAFYRYGFYDLAVIDAPHHDVSREGALYEIFRRMAVGAPFSATTWVPHT